MDYIEEIIIILPKMDNSLLGNICVTWGGILKIIILFKKMQKLVLPFKNYFYETIFEIMYFSSTNISGKCLLYFTPQMLHVFFEYEFGKLDFKAF